MWEELEPDLRDQYREAISTANRMAIVAVVHLVIRALALMQVDSELVGILGSLHKWVTVVVFAQFWIGVIVRGIPGMWRRD